MKNFKIIKFNPEKYNFMHFGGDVGFLAKFKVAPEAF